MSHSCRSMSGNQDLLPANNKNGARSISHVPVHDLAFSTPTGGTVFWKIWPAVMVHTVFSAIIVTISRETNVNLGIPNILLTLLGTVYNGVVIGFVISLRVSSAYDRYWWGRCAWSDLIKTTRTMSRLIWIHVPARMTKHDGISEVSAEEVGQAMREKRIALEILEAFAVAIKHHLRGELGIYYEDLYPIVRPLHEHRMHADMHATVSHSENHNPNQHEAESQHHSTPDALSQIDHINSNMLTATTSYQAKDNFGDPVIPAINEYGSFKPPGPKHKASYASYTSFVSTDPSEFEGEREPLLPSAILGPRSGASMDLIPFLALIANIGHRLNPIRWARSLRTHWREGVEGNDEAGGVGVRWDEPQHDGHSTSVGAPHGNGIIRRRRTTRQIHNSPGKHRPRVAGDGENLPLELLRSLSEWLSVLESRGTVGGNTLSGMFNCISSFEDCLSTLERILTTPLPFVYSAHISTIWIYLIFLPFQLADAFNWYTIPGTAVAAFFYLGFVAAGEAIEQPFGYDENDLDLDLFCREIIHADIHLLTSTPFPNAPIGSHHIGVDIYNAGTIVEVSQGKRRKRLDNI